MRDPRGFRPLNLGKLGDCVACRERDVRVRSAQCAVCSRNRAGRNGAHFASADRIDSLRASRSRCSNAFSSMSISRGQTASFLAARVNESREALGRLLAKEHPVDADIVVPVPDSGVPAAIGYSLESGIPFRMGLIRNHYIGRTFIEPSQAIRNFGVKLKLNPIRGLARRQARHPGRRLAGPRHHQPQNRAHGAGSRRQRSSRAHQLSADDFAVLLRR